MNRNAIYNMLDKSLFKVLTHGTFNIKIKWYLSLNLIGLEFHRKNMEMNLHKYVELANPNRSLNKPLRELLDIVQPKGIVRILDVGSGPIPKTGYVYNGTPVIIYPIDPLAKEYTSLLKKHGVIPPFYPIKGYGEKLTHYFPYNFFDLIHARNSIDHTSNPIKVIDMMIKVLKPGRYIYLNHYINEGDYTGYYGLHNWNFYEKDGVFWIANKTRKINVNINAHFEKRAEVTDVTIEGDRIIVIIKKRGDVFGAR